MSSDFGYVNARVRGMSARLLGVDDMQTALGAEDFKAFTSFLSTTQYAKAFDEARGESSGLSSVDRALANDFHSTTRSMLSFSDGQPRDLIAALLLRYDLEDLKTVVRAHHAGRSLDDMGTALVGAGQLRPATLEAMASAPDLPSAAQRLAVTLHPLGRAFTRAIRGYAGDRDLLAAEVSLDKAYFAAQVSLASKASTPSSFRRTVRREVDATNLRTALKVSGRDVDVGALFVEGGREVSRDLYGKIAAAGASALSQIAGGTFADLARADDASQAERSIRAALDAGARRASFGDALGIGVAIRFLRAKESETAKLRLLARGAFYGVPRETIRTEIGDA